MAKLMAYHMNRGGLEVSVYLSEGVRNSGDLMGLWAQSIPFRHSNQGGHFRPFTGDRTHELLFN